MFSSPIWDEEAGFGGNGDMSRHTNLNYGRCVTTGPFANMQLSYAGPDPDKHCLSRGFQDDNFHNYSGRNVQPDAIEALLEVDNYEELYEGVEAGPHDTIPNMVRGDFFLLSAPNGKTLIYHRPRAHGTDTKL